MFYTYIVRSLKTGKFYIGLSEDLEKRLKQHNSNRTKSIKYQGPFALVYREIYNTRREAYKRERQIKSYKGGRAFKKLITRCGTEVDKRDSL